MYEPRHFFINRTAIKNIHEHVSVETEILSVDLVEAFELFLLRLFPFSHCAPVPGVVDRIGLALFSA